MKSVITALAIFVFVSISLAQPHIEQGGTTPPRLPQAEGDGWYKQYDGGTDGILNVCFINRDTGWAGTLWTTNGGKTWATYQDDRYVIQFVDNKHGWSYGKTISNGIARTTDGGKTWEESPTGREDGRDAIFFCDSLHGYTSFYEEISRTRNGGKTWNIGSSHVGVVKAFACFDSIHVLATGDLYPSEEPPTEDFASLIYTSDGGENWARLNHLRTKWVFADAYASDSTTVFGVARRIYRSKNRGWEWRIDSIPKGDVQDPYLYAVHFSNAGNGTCVGTSGVIIRTTDGGESWYHQNSNTSLTLHDVVFVDSTYGWAVGDIGIILHTSDAGKTWVKQHPVVDILNTQVFPSPASTILTVGYTLPIPLPVIFTIIDMTGRELLNNQSAGIETQGVHFRQIPVHTLPSGSYWLRVRAAQHESMVKFTIVR